jgi:hypothetical protein
MGAPSASRQLAAFLAKYNPDIRSRAEAMLTRVRQQLPGAVEMVYDNYNALVIGFGPNDRASDAILSIALYPKWVNLYFLDGASLPDPVKLLQGSGNRVRRIKVDDPSIIDSPPVRALIAAAVKDADAPFDRATPRRLIVKAVAPRQRPRRPL